MITVLALAGTVAHASPVIQVAIPEGFHQRVDGEVVENLLGAHPDYTMVLVSNETSRDVIIVNLEPTPAVMPAKLNKKACRALADDFAVQVLGTLVVSAEPLKASNGTSNCIASFQSSSLGDLTLMWKHSEVEGFAVITMGSFATQTEAMGRSMGLVHLTSRAKPG